MSNIGIIDHRMGNLFSVFNAVEHLGGDAVICENPTDLNSVDKIILPGVGSFDQCMDQLNVLGFESQLQHLVIKEKIPILGICLGMQVMANVGNEGGVTKGLGWFDASVNKLPESGLRVPHVGWDNISLLNPNIVITEKFDDKDFYFAHSYVMENQDSKDITALCRYGIEFTVAVHRENIFGTQFHPEKSQDIGLALLERFVWEI